LARQSICNILSEDEQNAPGPIYRVVQIQNKFADGDVQERESFPDAKKPKLEYQGEDAF
jgi:hypothetical protein